jgi:hypothetical protein
MRQTALNRHRFERIGKLSSAITAHLVALALQCEYTAEVRVVTPKEEIENSYNDCHTASRKRLISLLARIVDKLNCSHHPACLRAANNYGFFSLREVGSAVILQVTNHSSFF